MSNLKECPSSPPTSLWIKGLWQLMRPSQWIKNGFVLAPLIFTGQFLGFTTLYQALLAFALFCLASSSVYILNDLVDQKADRMHPKKSLTRPLANQSVTPKQAITLMMVLIAALLSLGILTAPYVLAVIIGYILLNLAYTFKLKHQPVIDIFIIAICFVLRIYAGAVAIHVIVSDWMFITTFCLALFLAVIKRRQELLLNQNNTRQVLHYYSLALMDRYASMASISTLMFYSLFVLTAKPHMMISIPLVLFGFYRYWFMVESQAGGESPTDALLHDSTLAVTVLLWIVVCLWANWPPSFFIHSKACFLQKVIQ